MRISSPVFRSTLIVALLLAGACASGGARFTDFPMAPHRPLEVRERGIRLDRAVEEFIAIRGLERETGANLPGVTVTRWSPVAGIEDGDPPIAACPEPDATVTEREYRVRYRFTVDRTAGRNSLFVEAQWETLRGADMAGEDRWVECRSTGTFERNVQDQMLVRARMLSG